MDRFAPCYWCVFFCMHMLAILLLFALTSRNDGFHNPNWRSEGRRGRSTAKLKVARRNVGLELRARADELAIKPVVFLLQFRTLFRVPCYSRIRSLRYENVSAKSRALRLVSAALKTHPRARDGNLTAQNGGRDDRAHIKRANVTSSYGRGNEATQMKCNVVEKESRRFRRYHLFYSLNRCNVVIEVFSCNARTAYI
ncbi:hypothetical protein Tcan_05039 [Toxocara canis]|uniref:Uncharacterized protein n=1 Tax=Toxocara canis TaxID=6265 RepID=A0A0B2V8I5_TOXCA|nr:hypothetical protein Tcan_05039 [Toxocara canis]